MSRHQCRKANAQERKFEASMKHRGRLPDLLTGSGVSFSPHGVTALVSVEATSQRGQAFLVAYYEAIDEHAGGSFYGEPGDDDFEIEFLTVLLEEFDQLKRQASLAAVSIGELKNYPAYDSFA